MNLIPPGSSADYINTGTWATKAIKEIEILKKPFSVIASSEDRNFCYIPKNFIVSPGAADLHFTSNNTIKSTQWATFPNAGSIPLVSDMSSDILSRPFDPIPVWFNLCRRPKESGPAGVTLVIIREDMLARHRIFPPCFAIRRMRKKILYIIHHLVLPFIWSNSS